MSRLLQKWQVHEAIGKNLVRFEELNLRRRDGTKVGYTSMAHIEKTLGHPWWVVHRAHLHKALVEVAQKKGAEILIDSRVVGMDHQSSGGVTVNTSRGQTLAFDVLIGSDGINSVIRKAIMPGVNPRPPTTNCAYRAIVPSDRILKDPVTKELVGRLTMEVWMSEKAYIITYPISGGKDFNMVLSHHRPNPVASVEKVDMDELRSTYKDFDPRIKRVVDMIPEAHRWPLMVTGPLKTWSTPPRNVVLMGDAVSRIQSQARYKVNPRRPTQWSTTWLKAPQPRWKMVRFWQLC